MGAGMTSDIIQTPVDSLYQKLDELKEQNSSNKAKLRLIRKQIEDTIRKRDYLNEEVKKTSGEIRKLKASRDELNAKVKALKEKRNALRETAAQKREALSKLLEQAGHISEELQGSMSELLRQIRGLEWFIQTNPLAPKTERNMVAKVAALEVNLAKHKGLRNVKDKLLQLRVEVGALRLQAQTTHEELTRIAAESEKLHASMQSLVKVLADQRREADARHSEYLEQTKEWRTLAARIRENQGRIEEIRSQIGQAKTLPKLKGEQLKTKYKETANQKLRTGGKLSFEEFQALMEDSNSEIDED